MIVNEDFGSELLQRIQDGHVFLPYGRYVVKEPLNIRPDMFVSIQGEPGTVIYYDGPDNSALFQMWPHEGTESKMWVGRLWLQALNFDMRRDSHNCSIVRSMFDGMQLSFPRFRDVEAFATGYCFDFQNTGYSPMPEFDNITTRGGGGLRWTANRGGVVGIPSHHATSGMQLRGRWNHRPVKPIGPAIELYGHGAMEAGTIIIEGKLELRDDIKGNWHGPIGLRINAVREGCTIEKLWFELQGDFATRAPGCWIASFRQDSGSGGTSLCDIEIRNGIANGSALPEGPAFRTIGGQTVANRGMVLRVGKMRKPYAGQFLTAGKARVWFDSPTFEDVKHLQLMRDSGFVVTNPLIKTKHHVPGIESPGPQYVNGTDANDTGWSEAMPSC